MLPIVNVLHIIAGDLNKGAGRGAYWLHLGLRELNVNSKILTSSRTNLKDPHITSTATTLRTKISVDIYALLDNFPARFYKKREKALFSTGMFGFNFTKTAIYKEADIIHLHWINAGFVNLKHLTKINKSILWTIRDMWSFTGGCHISMGCERYKVGCGKCKQLKSNSKYDLSKLILNRKKNIYKKKMKIVGISHWISHQAKESILFRNFDIRTISNNVNTNDFFPIDKKNAQEILNVKTEKKIILVGSIYLEESYKGFFKYIEAVKQLDKDKYFLCFFGNLNNSDIIDQLGIEYKNFGFLHDIISLRLLYSMSDVFVAPSIMEPFGKTVIESMACGTPAVCFDATGPKDIITHKVDGYKAKPFKSEDLAKGIEWVANNKSYNDLCKNARDKVLKNFDSKVIAKKYIELYKEILNIN